jgi:phosphotriesterase-related protein
MAKRGVWIEYDWIGSQDAVTDATYISHIQRLLDAGYESQILLSHDRGWYDAGKLDFQPKPFTYISETFIPKLRDAEIGDETIMRLTHTNPFNAFAR